MNIVLRSVHWAPEDVSVIRLHKDSMGVLLCVVEEAITLSYEITWKNAIVNSSGVVVLNVRSVDSASKNISVIKKTLKKYFLQVHLYIF